MRSGGRDTSIGAVKALQLVHVVVVIGHLILWGRGERGRGVVSAVVMR